MTDSEIHKVKTERYKGKGRPKKSDYMTASEEAEILKKAIEKAESNGYRYFSIVDPDSIHYVADAEIWQYKKSPYNYYVGLREVIFSHDFAKAFFGEGKTIPHPYFENGIKAGDWRQHLQQMVLEENPIKYLEKFL